MKTNPRHLKKRRTRLAALRREIEDGRLSGEPVVYDPDAIKRRGRARLWRDKGNRRHKA